jgi:membrane protein insertase Oxa1/YidC/SpoIIIJ
MKAVLVSSLVLAVAAISARVDAFTPSPTSAGFISRSSRTSSNVIVGPSSLRTQTARNLAPVDPSHLIHELPQQLQSFHDALASSTFSIADLDAGAVDGSSTGDAIETAASKAGPFGFLTGPTMAFLQLLHTGLVAAGLGANSWGVSIIMLTLLIKLLTFPLTKSQLESTNKMQVR